MAHPIRVLALLFAASFPLVAFAQATPSAAQPVPSKSALLVVDAQVGVVSSIWESQRVLRNLEALASKARSEGILVVWVQHSDDEMKFGSDGWRLAPNFVPTASEWIIHKQYNSSFADTDLDRRLKALGISRLVLAGALTNWCIRSTAYAAVDRGYDLALVSDAHSTDDLKLPDGKTVPAESIVADLNAVFQWISVPSVRTEVKKTAEIKF